MNRERFIEIISAYGTREQNWPADETEAMKRQLLQPDYQQLLNRMSNLDDLLDGYEPRQLVNITPALMAQISQTSLFDRILGLLMPRQYGAFAASLVFAAGVLIGAINGADTADAATWDEEILTLSLEDVTQYE